MEPSDREDPGKNLYKPAFGNSNNPGVYINKNIQDEEKEYRRKMHQRDTQKDSQRDSQKDSTAEREYNAAKKKIDAQTNKTAWNGYSAGQKYSESGQARIEGPIKDGLLNQSSGIRYRVAGMEKNTIRAVGNVAHGYLLQSGEAGQGLRKTEEIVRPAATIILEAARRRLNATLKSSLREKLILQNLDRNPKEAIKQINRDLQKMGYNPVTGSGKQMQIIARRQLMRLRRNRANIPPAVFKKLEQHYKNLIMIGTHTTFAKKGFLARMAPYRALQSMTRYLKQNEAGKGLALTLTIASRAKMLTMAGIRAARSAVRAARMAAKLAVKASVRMALAIAKKARNNAIKKVATGYLKKASKLQSISRKMAARRLKRIERRKRFLDRFSPIRILKRKIREMQRRMVRKIGQHLMKYKIFRQLNKVRKKFQKFFRFFSVLFAKLSAVLTTIIHFFLIVLLIVVALGLFVALLHAVAGAIASAFNFANLEEDDENKTRIVAMETIQECYKEDMEDIRSLSDRYENVTLRYNDVRDDEAYEEKEADVEEEFFETTNAAEILSMTLVRFDYDLTGVITRNRVEDYVRQLYYGSHYISVVESVYTTTDEAGNEIEHKDATVTYTTYYFEDLFDCALSTTRHSSSMGAMMEAGSAEVRLWDYLISLGYSEPAVAGIMGNAAVETNGTLDPTMLQGGVGPAAGLFQWENYRSQSGRWLSLSNFAASRGVDWTDFQTQVDFMLSELEGMLNAYSGPNGLHGTYSTGAQYGWPDKITLSDFMSLDDPELATEIFERCFERAGKPDMPRRKNYATTYYNAYHGRVPGSGEGNDISQFALQFVGNPYVWGGTSLTNGVDCSGFVMKVYENFGYSLPHSSAALRSVGYAIDKNDQSQWQPGDILCYDGHVALYVGNDTMVHAQSTKTGIVTTTGGLQSYHHGLLAVRRIM